MRFLSLLLLLGACGSVSLSTIVQLSRLDPLTADPGGFVAAVELPEGLDVARNGATLGFSWASADETIGGDFLLQRHAAFEGSGIVPAAGRHVLFFDLAPEDAARIRQAQQQMAARKAAGVDGEGSLSVMAAPCTRGAIIAPVLSTYLRVKADGPFLPVLQDFDVRRKLSDGQIAAVPPCGARANHP